MKKSTKKMVSSMLAASMMFGNCYSVPVFAVDSTDAVLSVFSATKTLDATTLTASADKEVLKASEVPDFTITGDNQKRTASDGSVKGIDLAKNAGSSISFEASVGDTISIDVSSTGGSNTSAVALNDPSGTAVISTEVTGAADKKVTLTYEVKTAGVYTLLSPDSDYNRGFRLYSLSVGGASEETTTEATTVAPTTVETTTETTTKEVTTEVTTQATTVVTTTEITTVAPTTEATTETTTEAPVVNENSLDSKLDSAVSVEMKDYAAGDTLIDGLTAKIALVATRDISNAFVGADGTEYVYSKASADNNCIGAQDNGDAVEFVAPANGTVKIAFKVNKDKTGTVFGESVSAGASASAYLYREYTVKAGEKYTAGLSGSKIRIFYFGFTADGETGTEATTTAPVTEATTEATTTAPVTEATTTAPTTEAPTETTTTAPVSGEVGVKVSVADTDAETVDGVQKISSSKIGDKVKVNVDITSGGFNNYTFFIKYNPKVLEATGVSDIDDIANYATVNGDVVYNKTLVESSLKYVPSAENPDYADVNADGTTSAAKLGKIKLANYLANYEGDSASSLATATAGRLISLDFNVVGEGDSDIEIILVENGFYGTPDSDTVLTVSTPVNATVKVGDTSETTTSADKETTTESTTSANVETSTETTTVVPDGVLGVKATPASDLTLDAEGNIVAAVGDKVTINIDTINADQVPYNNYTMFITYDPEVIEAVEAVEPANAAKSASGNVAYSLATINNSINLQPSVANPDYADLVADVTTSPSAAELGKVKLAGIVGDMSGDGHETISVDGSVCAISFVVKSLGDANFKIELVDNGFYGDVSSSLISVQVVDSKIAFVEDAGVTIPVGDVDMEDPWTAQDASMILQKVLDSSYELPCEKTYPDTYYYIADVDADYILSANDAAAILSYVLDSTTKFAITDAIANGTYDYTQVK